MIKLDKENHNYLESILDEELKNRILNVESLNNDIYQYDMDDDLEIDLCDFLEDKQVEIGFDENYKPNLEWEKIQKILDELYIQTN